jgi:hypothetical protein
MPKEFHLQHGNSRIGGKARESDKHAEANQQ